MISLSITEEEAKTLVGLLEALKEQAFIQTSIITDPMNIVNEVATKQYKIADALISKIKFGQNEGE